MEDSNRPVDVEEVVDELWHRHEDVFTMWGGRHVMLSAHAEDVARELHDRLGSQVEIVLGSRRYPTGTWWPEEPGTEDSPPYDPLADTMPLPEWIGVEVDISTSVPIGPDRVFTARLTNQGTADVVVVTGGPPVILDAYLTTPGGSTALSSPGGFRHQMAVPTKLSPGSSAEFDAVVGFAATWYSAGYTVSPGDYELKLIVPIANPSYAADGSRPISCRTSGMALTVQPGW